MTVLPDPKADEKSPENGLDMAAPQVVPADQNILIRISCGSAAGTALKTLTEVPFYEFPAVTVKEVTDTVWPDAIEVLFKTRSEVVLP